MSSMLISAHEQAFRTLSRECHKAADDRIEWLNRESTQNDDAARQGCITAAYVLGSLAQALERSADYLSEHNDEISAGFSRMRD